MDKHEFRQCNNDTCVPEPHCGITDCAQSPSAECHNLLVEDGVNTSIHKYQSSVTYGICFVCRLPPDAEIHDSVDSGGNGETVGAPEKVWIKDSSLPRPPHIIDPVSTFPVTGYVKYVRPNSQASPKGLNFNETEWEFLAAIDMLEYLNFDTNMESVRDDAAEIATIIVNHSRANSQLVEDNNDKYQVLVRVLCRDTKTETLGAALAAIQSNSQLVTALVEALQKMTCTCFNSDGTWPHEESSEECNLSIANVALASLNPPLINLSERAVGLKEERKDAL